MQTAQLKCLTGIFLRRGHPYDATLVYKKGDNGRSQAEKIYKKRANRKIPAGALQFKTDGAPVSNPDYIPGQSAPAILEPAGYAGGGNAAAGVPPERLYKFISRRYIHKAY